MKLSLSRGMTINLGNYESARFDVSIERTFDDSMSTVEAFSILMKDIGLLEIEEEGRIRKGPRR